MDPILTIATRAARKAANFIARSHEQLLTTSHLAGDIRTEFKASCRQVSHLIERIVYQSYPEHRVMTPESPPLPANSPSGLVVWYLNPIDGEVNFCKGFPHFCLSLAVKKDQRTEAALVYDIQRNDIFTAVRGKGAQLNNYRIRCGGLKQLNQAMVLTQNISEGANFPLLQECYAVRQTGVPTLDLCYLAAGRGDIFLGRGLSPFDFYASSLIAKEAGCLVSDFEGHDRPLLRKELVAGNLTLVKKTLIALRAAANESPSSYKKLGD